MNIRNKILFISFCILFFSVFSAQVHAQDKASDIINRAVDSAGGNTTWQQNGNLVVYESQLRYEDEGTIKVNLIHTMSTENKGYRIELSRTGINTVYGWDGTEFWATVDGKPGNHDVINEARRVISDAYFRFSLPFILDDSEQKAEFTGNDSVNGSETDVIKITYAKSPADRYFLAPIKEHSHDAGDTKVEHNDAKAEHNNAKADHNVAKAEHSAASAGHGHGGEVYNFHFNKENQLTKVYFSHHGDGTYETILLEDFKVVDGINRGYKRTLLRPDGQTLYLSNFTSIDFVKEINDSLFSKP
ncbi:MAG: hypothetical protein ACI9XC_002161 [Gammaproteobacteria bacterium]|jgi:hypothetical protein